MTKKENQTVRYVALLRGINVGGNKKVPMEQLKKVFEAMGFSTVRTILNTGNVLFESKQTSLVALVELIEGELEKKFGFPISVSVRALQDIKKIITSNPFKSVAITPETRLYVTFLKEAANGKLKIPFSSPDKSFRILTVSNGAVFTVILLTSQKGTTDAMLVLEKEFGKNVTTRNWNTVLKIAS